MLQTVEIDRLSLRKRPRGWPIMNQVWDKLLFLHWPIEPAELRPHIPERLEIDTFEGEAWIGVTPFTMRGVRPPLLPPLPLVSRSHELNVRTYVHRDGVPGVWFFSLDASNPLAVWGARLTFALPYFRAAMKLDTNNERIHFRSRRTHRGAVPAELDASWTRGPQAGEARPGTRDFFLIERYCLYAESGGRLYRARIHHQPWPLCTANLIDLASTMLQSHGLKHKGGAPVVHAQAAPLHVEVWPLRRVGPP